MQRDAHNTLILYQEKTYFAVVLNTNLRTAVIAVGVGIVAATAGVEAKTRMTGSIMLE